MHEFLFDTDTGRVILTFAEALALLVPLLIGVAYLTYAERKVLAAMQLRKGPNVVGPFGLLQPFADALKMIMKETIIPAGANRLLFLMAPMLTFCAGDDRLGGDPGERRLGDRRYQCRHPVSVRDQLARRLRHHHRRLGVQFEIRLPRRDAQCGADGQLRSLHGLRHGLRAAVRRQPEPDGHRAGAAERLVLPAAVPDVHRVLHLGLAETNRSPFDLPEGESEIVAGFFVEYSAMAFALFFLGEYANMILMSAMTTILFLGGWLAPFGVAPFTWIPGAIWFMLKICFCLFVFLWVRATFPRYRYDQFMRLGWKVFLPLSLIWLTLTAGALMAFGWLPNA